MMTFLKKLGQILAKAAAVAAGIYPIVQPLLGSGKVAQVATTAVNDFTLMVNQIVTIETALQGVPGIQKLQAAIPLIANVIKTSEVVVGKKIQNEELFTKAVEEYAQATVDLLNAIHPDEAKTD